MSKRATKEPSRGLRELRAINISLDIHSPERLHGYLPTAKSIVLANEVFSSLSDESNERAFVISAPYGSGKSSAGLFWSFLAEGTYANHPAIRTALQKLRAKVKSDHNQIDAYLSGKRRAMAVPVHGFSSSIPESLIRSLVGALKRHNLNDLAKRISNLPFTLEGAIQAIDILESKLSDKKNALLITWDEFGKALEYATAASDSKSLFEIQTIAERCARSTSEFPVVLLLVLHQSFGQYASSLPSYIKVEWTKIEGRFKQISYIEDSKEIYELIGELAVQHAGRLPGKAPNMEALAAASHSVGMFKEFDKRSLAALFGQCRPLSPLALFILPHISARVGQNERTLFGYLASKDQYGFVENGPSVITPAEIFDYFSDLMKRDTGLGGSFKIWSSANTALNRISDPELRAFVKTVACLGLAKSHTSITLNQNTVALAHNRTTASEVSETKASLDKLCEQKVLFFQRLTGEYSVWNGTDTDIRSAIQQNKQRCEPNLILREFLSREFPAPARYPQRHNDQRCIRRYFDGFYVDASDLEASISGHLLTAPVRDGRIYYVLAESKKDCEAALLAAKKIKDRQVLIAVPNRPLTIRSTAAELKACHDLLNNPDYASEISGSASELKQLTDECESFLRSQLDSLITPSPKGVIFFHQGQRVDDIESPGELKRYLSNVCDKLYSLSPVFNNELINKSEVSPPIVNARKKLIRAILSEYGKESFGLVGYGPEVSSFRSLLLTTGLYKKEKSGAWRFARPNEIKDRATREVWTLILEFWTGPSEEPKNTEKLIEQLLSPPYGVRPGVLSILFVSGLKCALNPVTILEDNVYLTELRAESFERLIRNPTAFRILVPSLGGKTATYLDSISSLFGSAKGDRDKLRSAVSSVMVWAKELPPAAMNSGMISKDVDRFVALLRTARDPAKLVLEDLHSLAETRDNKRVIEWLSVQKREMESIEGELLKKCREGIYIALGAKKRVTLHSLLFQWKHALPGEPQAYFGDQLSSGFLTRVSQNYETENDLLRSLAELFSGKSVKHWDSSTFALFQSSLAATIKTIEATAEMLDLDSLVKGCNDVSLPWVERRIKGQIRAISSKIGLDRTKSFLNRLLNDIEKNHD